MNTTAPPTRGELLALIDTYSDARSSSAGKYGPDLDRALQAHAEAYRAVLEAIDAIYFPVSA